jgi:hypothetical protein
MQRNRKQETYEEINCTVEGREKIEKNRTKDLNNQ